MQPLVVSAAIFIVAYLIIATERIHRTLVALGAAVAMIFANILTQQEAFQAIDFNVIFLLAGMMIIANIMSKTGAFEWLAIKSVKIAHGEPYFVLIVLSLITAVASAILNNVTTVILLAPLALFIADNLKISAVPLLLAEVLASNIGGTATLIGDPPNIMISSAADIDFFSFLLNAAPISFLTLIAFLVAARFLFRNEFRADDDGKAAILTMDESKVITDPSLLRKSTIVLILTMAGFLLQGVLGYEPATVALAGAVLLMLVANQDPHEVFRDVEWTTLFFFVGLFILVGGIVNVGLIDLIAQGILSLTQGDLSLTTFSILWGSALVSGFVDNIPYTATMIPLVKEMGSVINVEPLWWALIFGTCFGGNLTLVGASANLVAANIGQRSGHPISFLEFLKHGTIVTLASMIFSTGYIWLRYLN